MSDETKDNDTGSQGPEEDNKPKKKKVWIPGKDGQFKPVMREVKKPEPEPEEQPQDRTQGKSLTRHEQRAFPQSADRSGKKSDYPRRDDSRDRRDSPRGRRDDRRDSSRERRDDRRDSSRGRRDDHRDSSRGRRDDSRDRKPREFPRESDSRPGRHVPERVEKPPAPVLGDVQVLYTIGMQRSNPQRLLQNLADTEINVLIDVRGDNAMFAPGFVKARDLAILLKESANIEYRREEVLIPSRDMVARYERDENWKRFKESYLQQLGRYRVSEVLDRGMFVKFKVALLGERRDPDKDTRGVLAEYLKDLWDITAVHHI